MTMFGDTVILQVLMSLVAIQSPYAAFRSFRSLEAGGSMEYDIKIFLNVLYDSCDLRESRAPTKLAIPIVRVTRNSTN